MRFKHTLLLLFLSLSNCAAQVDVHLPNSGDAAMQEWVKVYLQEWLSKLKPRTDTTTIPTEPNPGTPCSAGPNLTSVFNAAKNELAFSFTGDLQTIHWYILSGTTVVRNGGVVAVSKLNTEIGFQTLAAGTYKFKIDGVNCVTSKAIEFTIVSDTPTCQGGPTISSISNVSSTGLTYTWNGLNVPEIVWSIIQNGSTIRTGSSATSNTTVSITFPQLSAGTYQLRLVGLTCPSNAPPVTFTITGTPPPVSTGERHVYMNLTGYGFDPGSPSGMDSDWVLRIESFLNLNYQGQPFSGIDGIRVNVKWHEYEPNEGTFRDDKILAILNWCVQRGLRLSIALIPWRREGDNMFSDYHKVRTSDGKIWYMEGDLPTTYKTYQPSVQSELAHAKFKASAKHMAQVLKQANPNYVDYISTATSQTEEFQLIRNESPLLLSGYADVDKSMWASYSGGLPVPYANSSDLNVINQMMDSPTGKKWYEFHTNGLKRFHAAFVQGVREGGMRACGMYAGIGAPSAVYDFTYKLNTIYSAGLSDQPDIIYSSEGDAGSQNSKLMATDLNMGTFPGAETAIEFDPEDVAANQIRNPPYGVDLNGNILWDYGSSFFRRGGKLLHFAMSFHPSKVSQMTEALWKIKTQFLNSSTGMTGIDQGIQINFQIVRYSGLQEYRGMYGDAGGGLNKQVKIKLTGTDDPGLPPGSTAITSYLDNNSAAYNNNILFDVKKSSGTQYSYSKGEYNRDSQVSVMSLTKSVTAAVMLKLVEEGLLSLNTTVGSLIPSWNSGSKASITLKQIISHTSGIPDDQTNEGASTLQAYVDWLAGRPGFGTPGAVFSYSTVSYQVAARMAEVLTGQKWKQIFESRIRNKCGMGSAEYNPLGPGPVYGNPDNPHAGYGLYVTQNEYSNFMAMIRDNGLYNGQQVLSPTSINLLCTDATDGKGPWGFGMIRNDASSAIANEPTSESQRGCYAWVNRSKGISCVLFTQSDYSPTIGINNGLRDLTRSNF